MEGEGEEEIQGYFLPELYVDICFDSVVMKVML